MSKRLLCLTLLALTTVGSSGCQCINCLHDNLLALYKSRRWADCGCGEVYYGPWIDTPPKCCDPCDCYGNFTGGRQYWTSGSQWRQNGGAPIGTPDMGPPMMNDGMELQGQPMAPGSQMPTPAGPQMNQPTPAGPPPSLPPRMGRRPQGMAMRTPNPYDSSYTYPPSRSAYFNRLPPNGGY